MAQEQSWSDFGSGGKQGGSKGTIVNLRLEANKTYEVRFIGSYVKYFKYFVAGKSAVTMENWTDCIIKKKYNLDPSERFAINVIDRADGQLKVLDVPPSVLKPVAAWANRRKIDPGGDNGCDFSISVTGEKINRRYEVISLDPSPLTEAEKQLREKAYDLKKLYKAVPQDQIEARLGMAGASAAVHQASAPAVQQAPVQAAPARQVVQAAQAVAEIDIPF